MTEKSVEVVWTTSPSDWNSGFHEVSYIYENDTASQNIYIISEPELIIETTTNSAHINFSPLLTIDQYRFRYTKKINSKF